MGLTAVPIPGTACSDRSVALLVELLAERLVESLAASMACSESILVLTGIIAAIGADGLTDRRPHWRANPLLNSCDRRRKTTRGKNESSSRALVRRTRASPEIIST
jgi:hypothetical protein